MKKNFPPILVWFSDHDDRSCSSNGLAVQQIKGAAGGQGEKEREQVRSWFPAGFPCHRHHHRRRRRHCHHISTSVSSYFVVKMKWRQWQQVKGKRPFHRNWGLQSVLRRSFSLLAVQQGDNVFFWGLEKENDNIHNHWLLIINYGQVCNCISKDKVNKIWVDKGEGDILRMLLIIHLITTILILMILIFCLSKDLSDRGLRFSGPPPTTLPTKSSTLLPSKSSHQIQLNTNTVCLKNKCSFILFTPNSKMLQEHVIVGIWTTRAE